MVRRKGANAIDRVVWRMTSPTATGNAAAPGKPVEVPEYGWLASSLELLNGVRVSETPMDTLPGELIDEFFKARH